MKRRNVLAAYAVMLLTMTGIAVARQWAGSGPYAQFVDAGRTWKLSGDFGGEAIVRNADGKIIGECSHPDEKQMVGPLTVMVAGVTATIQGIGRHEIADKFGKPLGSVEISPMTAEEIADAEMTSEKRQWELAACYAPNPRFPMGESTGTNSTTAMPGLLNSYDSNRGLSWKLLGYAEVTVRYPDFPWYMDGGKSTILPRTGAKKMIGPGGALDQLLKFAPAQNAEPVLYFAAADKASSDKRYPIKNGWWKSVRQTGTFRGYGKHDIRDESGKIIVTLTVTPLKAK